MSTVDKFQEENEAVGEAISGLAKLAQFHRGTAALLGFGAQLMLIMQESLELVAKVGDGDLRDGVKKLEAEGENNQIVVLLRKKLYKALKQMWDMIPPECFQGVEEPATAAKESDHGE